MKHLLPLLALLPSLLFAQTSWSSMADISWYNSLESEFTITTAEQLAGLAVLVNYGDSMRGKTFTLGNDIALNNTTDWKNWGENSTELRRWTAIGAASSYPFSGTFDGDGYVVSGVYISSGSSASYGLFGNIDYGSTIKNLGVVASYIKGDMYVGSLAGRNFGTITNSYATGDVVGTNDYVGGLVGYNGATISNSYATGDVVGTRDYVGGLVGSSGNGSISNSYAKGNVSGTNNVGGLVGYNYGPITNSYATGNVNGTTYVGGLAGRNFGTISKSYYIQTDGQTDNGLGTPKDTAQMQTQATYTDWDFTDTWYIGPSINNGMPHLISGIFPIIDATLKATYGDTLKNVKFPTAGYQWAAPNTPLSAGTWQFEAIHAISKGTVSVDVAKATPPYTVPTNLAATYGDLLPSVKLPEGWSWEGTGKVGNAGTQTHTAKFTPSDTANYNIVNRDVNIKVEKADPIYTKPTDLEATYGDPLSSVKLPDGWSWESTGAVGDVGTQTHKAKFTPSDTNYNVLAGYKLTVTVAQASGSPSFATVPAINAEFEEGLTLADLEALPSGCSWTNPKTPVRYIGDRNHEAIYADPNYEQAAAGTVTVKVSKNPGPEPEFPAISVNATFKENLTLANITLPSGYAWAEPSTKITSPDDGQQFDATHANSYYDKPSAGKITVNASSGAGVVAIDGWSYGEKPGTPLTETITNGAATLLYTGKTNGGTTYSNTLPPSEAGRYTLTATFAAKGGSGEIVRTAEFTIEKSEGIGAARIDGWKSGSKASDPLVESETNGTEDVSYIYGGIGGTSYAPQPSKPSNAGNYMLIAIFPETDNYTEARDTTYFTISKPDAIELAVAWSDDSVFTYSKMLPRPVPSAEHNGTEIPLIVLKTRSDAGEYSGVTEAIAMVEDEASRTDYILKNSTRSYTVEKKPLVPRFTVKNPIDEFDAKEDTIWVPRSIFSNPALLSSILAELIDYEGFARDTVKNESDNASVLSGYPSVEIVYENPASQSSLYRRVETTRKATAIIVTEDVSAKNYELIKTNVTIVETLEEEDGTQQVSCSVNSSCAPMSGNSCSAIGGEAFASCTMRCSVGNACAPMPVSSCAIMEGEIVDICPGEEVEPVRRPVLSGGSLRIWQTASGVVNVDLGYTPSAPVVLRVYSIKGKLVATERVSTRFASVRVSVPSGVYLVKVGGRSAVAIL